MASGELPVFDSDEGRRTVMAAYDAVLDCWPVSYEQLDVPTSFGTTHVIASGPEDRPSVVLLHALFATATAWYRTVGALSGQYRTLAVDVLGDANRSRPVRPITSPGLPALVHRAGRRTRPGARQPGGELHGRLGLRPLRDAPR